MKKNLCKLAFVLAAGFVLTACSNNASSDATESAAETSEAAAETETECQQSGPQFETDENGSILVEKDSPLPFGKSRAEVADILGSAGEEGDAYEDENEVRYDTVDYDMIWFNYENPIVTCFTFREDVLTLIELEMDQHVTKELAREIMTNYYGEADETQISDYGTICIWEDADNDRRFVLIPDEYDRYVVEITSLSSGESSVVETEIPVLEESTGAAAENEDAGEFGKFTSADLDMNDVDQSILAGHKLTLINVWATFCGPCLNEMPSLGELNTEYADQGFQIVGIVTDVVNSDGTLSDSQVSLAKEYAEKTGANYLHLLPTADLYEIALKNVTGVPTSYFVDENGHILKEVVGAQSKDDWAADIEELLEG